MNDYILNLGTTVNCNEKECGKLAKIAFNHETWQVSDLVVEEGLLLKRARVFPFHLVRWATNDQIDLALAEDELKNFPEYRETILERAIDGNFDETAIVQGSPYGLATSAPPVPMVRELIIEGVASHLTILDKGTTVHATDSAVGTVRGLITVPENGLITHLLVHKGTIFVDEYWLTTSLVDHFGDQDIYLNVNKEQLESLIEYEEKHDLTEPNWGNMPTDMPLDKPAYTTGNSIANGNGTVNGNDTAVLSDNAALAAMIAENLMNDPRTADTVIEVIHERGQVTLLGTVPGVEVKAAAEEITCEYPGVVSVSNQLVVDPRH